LAAAHGAPHFFGADLRLRPLQWVQSGDVSLAHVAAKMLTSEQVAPMILILHHQDQCRSPGGSSEV